MPDYEQSGFTASLHPACPARSPFHAPLRQRGRSSGYPRPDVWNSPSHLRGFAREAVSFMHLSSRVAAKDAKFCPDTCNSPSRLRGFAREIVLLSTPGSSRVAAKSRPVAGRPRDCRDRWLGPGAVAPGALHGPEPRDSSLAGARTARMVRQSGSSHTWTWVCPPLLRFTTAPLRATLAVPRAGTRHTGPLTPPAPPRNSPPPPPRRAPGRSASPPTSIP